MGLVLADNKSVPMDTNKRRQKIMLVCRKRGKYWVGRNKIYGGRTENREVTIILGKFYP